MVELLHAWKPYTWPKPENMSSPLGIACPCVHTCIVTCVGKMCVCMRPSVYSTVCPSVSVCVCGYVFRVCVCVCVFVCKWCVLSHLEEFHLLTHVCTSARTLWVGRHQVRLRGQGHTSPPNGLAPLHSICRTSPIFFPSFFLFSPSMQVLFGNECGRSRTSQGAFLLRSVSCSIWSNFICTQTTSVEQFRQKSDSSRNSRTCPLAKTRCLHVRERQDRNTQWRACADMH